MRSHRTGVTWLTLMALVVALGGAATAQEKQWWPFPVEDRDPPFNMEGKKIKNQYTPLAHAAKKWNICVSFPHMKDAYWTAVDYGVVAESRRLGVKMQLVEAGGYTNLPRVSREDASKGRQAREGRLVPRPSWRRLGGRG